MPRHRTTRAAALVAGLVLALSTHGATPTASRWVGYATIEDTAITTGSLALVAPTLTTQLNDEPPVISVGAYNDARVEIDQSTADTVTITGSYDIVIDGTGLAALFVADFFWERSTFFDDGPLLITASIHAGAGPVTSTSMVFVSGTGTTGGQPVNPQRMATIGVLLLQDGAPVPPGWDSGQRPVVTVHGTTAHLDVVFSMTNTAHPESFALGAEWHWWASTIEFVNSVRTLTTALSQVTPTGATASWQDRSVLGLPIIYNNHWVAARIGGPTDTPPPSDETPTDTPPPSDDDAPTPPEETTDTPPDDTDGTTENPQG